MPNSRSLGNSFNAGLQESLSAKTFSMSSAICSGANSLRNSAVIPISGGALVETTLALSGSGPDGIFGAGLLNGWTVRGDGPEFEILTGNSSGANLGASELNGSDCDVTCSEIYMAYSTEGLIEPSLFTGLAGGTARFDVRGFRDLS